MSARVSRKIKHKDKTAINPIFRAVSKIYMVRELFCK